MRLIFEDEVTGTVTLSSVPESIMLQVRSMKEWEWGWTQSSCIIQLMMESLIQRGHAGIPLPAIEDYPGQFQELQQLRARLKSGKSETGNIEGAPVPTPDPK